MNGRRQSLLLHVPDSCLLLSMRRRLLPSTRADYGLSSNDQLDFVSVNRN